MDKKKISILLFIASLGTIISEAEQGWRLKQIVTPFDEKLGVFVSKCYQVVFEREI